MLPNFIGFGGIEARCRVSEVGQLFECLCAYDGHGIVGWQQLLGHVICLCFGFSGQTYILGSAKVHGVSDQSGSVRLYFSTDKIQ